MFGQAKADVPRWRRKKAPPGPVVTVKGRHARKLTRDLQAAAALASAQRAAGVPGAIPLPTGLYRFRYQLMPFAWLGWTAGAAFACSLYAHPLTAALITGTVSGAAMALFTRHLNARARYAALGLAVLAATWTPVLAVAGWGAPAPALLALSWVGPLAAWVSAYRVRHTEPRPEPRPSAMELWDQSLGAKGRLAGSHLRAPQEIPNGTRYHLALKRGEQDSSDVFGMSKKIASLFGKPVTEVYPERFHDGREHEVMITLLRSNSLATVRRWDGGGIDPATGLAAIGDFPDGTPAHFRFWSPRSGAEQSVVVGVKGAGKSYTLHLLLSIAVTSSVPVIPIVLDPQQGQSLPDWRGRVAYARGVEESMTYLGGFEKGMEATSAYLADLAWTDSDGYERPGFDFYDPHLSGLPLVFCVFDEAHLVLGDPKHGTEAQRRVGNLVKLNRKAGGHLVLVSHSLLLSQLGDMTLRAMVVGGNVIAQRTGESLSGGIVGLEADPKLLPRTFPDGSETYGLGYTVGPDNRPDSPMRLRLVPNPRKVAMEAPRQEMHPVFGDAFTGYITGRATPFPVSPALAAVPAAGSDDDAPAGRTAADAILTVLAEADGPLGRGAIVTGCGELATMEWGRAKAFSTRGISTQLTNLTSDGRIERAAHDQYRLPLHAVSGGAR